MAENKNTVVAVLFCIVLCHDLVSSEVLLGNSNPRFRRGILSKWFGGEKNEALQSTVYHHQAAPVQTRVHTVNQQVPHYPIWKVHKYNGINLKPLPVSMVPQYPPVQITETVRNVNPVPPTTLVVPEQPKATPLTVKLLEPIVVAESPLVSSKTEEDIRGIMKLLGLSDPSQVPSVQEVMDMLGASTPEEAVDTVKEIAATEEGISLIKSFIESRQTPEDEGIIEVITQPPTTTSTTSTTTTTTTTTPAPPPPTVPVIPAKKPFHHFWSPKAAISSATAGVASRLDQVHTNAHLLGKILPNTESTAPGQSAFRNTLRNIKNFFTFQDNTPIPLEKIAEPVKKTTAKNASPSVVYINEPIPAAPINLPALPQLSPLPELPSVRNLPQIPKMPQIQLPSHFSIPRNVVQGPYMKVQYPVASLAPLPMFRQRPLYSYRGQPISNAPPAPTSAVAAANNVFSSSQSSYEAPLYGPPSPVAKAVAQPASQAARIPLSTRDAFQNAPQIISSLPVPSLPYTFEEQQNQQQQVDVEDQYTVAANTPIESVVAIPRDEIEDVLVAQEEQVLTGTDTSESLRDPESAPSKDDEDEAVVELPKGVVVAGVPQRLSGYEPYATGKVHRATNVDIVASRLTNGEQSVDNLGGAEA